MKYAFLYSTLLLLLTGNLPAIEDAYHRYLRSQLAGQYGVTGGDWVLPDNEVGANKSAQAANVICTTIPGAELEMFSQVLEIVVPERRANSWDNIVRFSTMTALQKDDVLLLVLWLNNPDSLVAGHDVTFAFEKLEAPFDKMLFQPAKIRSGWRQWFLPILVTSDAAKGRAQFQLHLGAMQGTLQVGGVAILNFQSRYRPENLPQSAFHLEYEGQEEGALWRQHALARIADIRQQPLNIRVVNKYGEPIAGATVQVTMRRHEFGFGTAVSSDLLFENSYNARLYQQKLENLNGDGRSFNTVTLENALKWPSWEDENLWGTREQARQAVEWFTSRGLKVRGHNLLWPNWSYMPADLKARYFDRPYLLDRVKNHIYDEAGYAGLAGRIAEWDVLNEINHNADLTAALGSDEIYSQCLKWAARADPAARLYINETEIITNGGFQKASRETLKATISTLQQTNAPLHGVGIQGHMDDYFTPPERLLDIFTEFADYNLDLSITEYDAAGANEDIAADYMRDVLIAAFSTPRMQNFIMWGFWDGAHWKGDSPIFRTDWSLKPSGYVFIDYVFNKWWTKANGATDHDGFFRTPGYLGDYDIAVAFGSLSTDTTFALARTNDTLVLQFDTDRTTAALPELFHLEQNYPNPFNATTTVSYFLPARMPVLLEIYDQTGRKNRTLLNEDQAEGRHSFDIDGSTLASGIYFLHMRSGYMRQVVKLVVVK